jgi:hypothetical protein
MFSRIKIKIKLGRGTGVDFLSENQKVYIKDGQ